MIRNKGVVTECFVIFLTLLLVLFSRALSRMASLIGYRNFSVLCTCHV